MSEQQKADFLMKYIYNLTGDGGIAVDNLDKIWEPRHIGQDALLGDIVTNNPPIAVCRHRGLLFKVLGDEVGLRTELQRGNFYQYGSGGGHAWNTVRFSDGTSAIYDAMHNRKSSTTPGQVDNYALCYQDTNGNILYDRGLSNNINNANGNKSRASADIEIISVEPASPNIEIQNNQFRNNAYNPALDPAMYDPALYDPAVYDPNLNLFDDI